jgi:hypothetical protein
MRNVTFDEWIQVLFETFVLATRNMYTCLRMFCRMSVYTYFHSTRPLSPYLQLILSILLGNHPLHMTTGQIPLARCERNKLALCEYVAHCINLAYYSRTQELYVPYSQFSSHKIKIYIFHCWSFQSEFRLGIICKVIAFVVFSGSLNLPHVGTF